MKLYLKIWRQLNAQTEGKLVDYELEGVEADMSFLEMLDYLNEKLILKGEMPVEFDHDCREGICGTCGLFINGRAHGPLAGTTTCQLHMRSFNDGDTIYIEPFRGGAFKVIRDLKIDRSAMDRILQVGGFISTSVGDAPEANTTPITHDVAESAFDSAALYWMRRLRGHLQKRQRRPVYGCKDHAPGKTSARFGRGQAAGGQHGRANGRRRVRPLLQYQACQVECPQLISVANIDRMNWEYNRAKLLK